MPRSMATPMPPATRKASGAAMRSDQSKSQGALLSDHLLGDEGGVGAEHDQLAMRHVDDAHHAEGDGEADGGEQQHRAEREAEPDVLRLRPHRLHALDGGDAFRRGLGDLGLVDGAERHERREGVAAAVGGDGLDRRDAGRDVGVGFQQRGRAGVFQRLPAPRDPVPSASAVSIASSCSGSGVRKASAAARHPAAGSWAVRRSVESAERIERRSELLTRIAFRRARAAPARGSRRSAGRSLGPGPAPGDAHHDAVGLACVRDRRPGAPRAARPARSSPVAPIAATTSARSE